MVDSAVIGVCRHYMKLFEYAAIGLCHHCMKLFEYAAVQSRTAGVQAMICKEQHGVADGNVSSNLF